MSVPNKLQKIVVCMHVHSCVVVVRNFLRATECNAIAGFCYGRGVHWTSVRLSVRPSVRHTAVLCENDATEDHEIFTVHSLEPLVSNEVILLPLREEIPLERGHRRGVLPLEIVFYHYWLI